ncbi:MAG: TadE family protein [Pirellulaceae bacterium]|nr:TadE family protein [Pirellulaceae bacterium]
MRNQSKTRKYRRTQRTAAALVELAICLPLIAFLVGATVEACDLIFLRNSLATASYSGTLEVSRAGCTQTSITNQITQVLNAAQVKDFTISITKANGGSFATSVKGDLIRIQVSAVSASNLRIGRFIPTAAGSISVQSIAIR